MENVGVYVALELRSECVAAQATLPMIALSTESVLHKHNLFYIA